MALVFLDWDDTLFPTTLVFHKWKKSMYNFRWLDYTNNELDLLTVWANAVLRFIAELSTIGRIVIVSSSKPGWVERTINFFIPELLQFDLAIHHSSHSDPMRGKFDIFKSVLDAAPEVDHVISIGDSYFERDAAIHLREHTSSLVHIVMVRSSSMDDFCSSLSDILSSCRYLLRLSRYGEVYLISVECRG